MRMGFEFAQKIKANLVCGIVDRLVKEGYSGEKGGRR